jgi:hypothetical protein
LIGLLQVREHLVRRPVLSRDRSSPACLSPTASRNAVNLLLHRHVQEDLVLDAFEQILPRPCRPLGAVLQLLEHPAHVFVILFQN